MVDIGYSAAILIGGKNSRMLGENKALIKLGSETLIERMLRIISPVFDDIVFIVNEDRHLYEKYSEIRIYKDIIPGKAALSGIHAALSHCRYSNCFVFACDLPMLNEDFIHKQIGHISRYFDAIIPVHKYGIEPLHAIYAKRCIDILEKHLNESDSLKIQSYLDKINTLYFDTEVTDIFTNINSHKDLDSFKKANENNTRE